MALPDIRVIERRHIYTHLAPRLRLADDHFPQIRIRVPPRRAVLHHLARARRADLRDHHRLGAERDDDGAGPADEIGRVHARQPRIAAAAGVEVDAGGFGGVGQGILDVVAHTPGFEAAGGLEILEFEEDSASTV